MKPSTAYLARILAGVALVTALLFAVTPAPRPSPTALDQPLNVCGLVDPIGHGATTWLASPGQTCIPDPTRPRPSSNATPVVVGDDDPSEVPSASH